MNRFVLMLEGDGDVFRGAAAEDLDPFFWKRSVPAAKVMDRAD